jgi:hypothetical protein
MAPAHNSNGHQKWTFIFGVGRLKRPTRKYQFLVPVA